MSGEERDTSRTWVREGGTRINFLFVLMVTPHYLQTQRCQLSEGNESLDSELNGQIYVPVSMVDTYPKNLSFCNICVKF